MISPEGGLADFLPVCADPDEFASSITFGEGHTTNGRENGAGGEDHALKTTP